MATFTNKPDQAFYSDVIEHDDGSYEATARPVDDIPARQTAFGNLVATPGVRSMICQRVQDEASKRIYIFAPEYKQRNTLFAISNYKGRPDLTSEEQQQLDDAIAMWDKINMIRDYVNTQCQAIRLLSFDQLLTWVMPTDWPLLSDADQTVTNRNAYTTPVTMPSARF
jgi:hypothetical protein